MKKTKAKANDQATVKKRFTMTFPQTLIQEPIMHTLSTKLGVVPNLLRGRITQSQAHLEIELAGKKSSIEKALKYLNSLGVATKEG